MSQIERSPVDLDALRHFLDSRPSSGHRFMVQDGVQLIHHYTDLEALSGIVGGHDLWLTNSQYSNDEDESRLGEGIARSVVEIYLNEVGLVSPLNKLKVDYAKALYSLLEKLPPGGFYICCFCEEGNLLSQWRSYGANGTGVSLGFDPIEFVGICGPDMPLPLGLMRLWQVFYDVNEQKDIVQSAIKFVWDNRGAQDAQQLASRAADAIQFFIPTFKNTDFSEEKERRLIFTPDQACPVKPLYRVGRGMLIPYYRVHSLAEAAGRGTPNDPWPLPLRSIMVGPSAQKVLNVESTMMLLKQNGYDNVKVEASATPYRA